MAVYAVIPVKTLNESKQRLSSVFNPQERRQLTLAMLNDVVNALRGSKISKIVISATDPEVHQIAKKLSITYFSPSQDGLNQAIDQATTWCIKDGAHSFLVLPADLPFLTAQEINNVITIGKTESSLIVICPSWDLGTNALFQKSTKQISAHFGPNSFIEHTRHAYCNGVSVWIHFSPGISTDIDSEKDLNKLFEIKSNTECKKVLEKLTAKSKTRKAWVIKNS